MWRSVFDVARWPLVFILIFLLLSLGDDAVRQWLRFDRDAIAAGEWWRVLTCHWVHLGWNHTLLNSAGMLLVAWLLPKGRWQHWLVFWLAASVVTTLGVWLDDRTHWYVGASGVLHGVLVLATWFSVWLEPWRRKAMLAIIAGKLIWEQTPWYNDGQLMDVIGGYVVVDAHLYGGLTAYAIVLLFLFRARLRTRQRDVIE